MRHKNTYLQKFQSLINQAEVLVAHNMSFDEKIVGAELLRAGMYNSIPAKNKICTMQSTTNFCAIDGPYGYKWPKLSELHYKLFRTDYEEAHNASVDITATAKCFWELKRLGYYTGEVDGKWYTKTSAAVLQFQKANPETYTTRNPDLKIGNLSKRVLQERGK